MSSWLGLLSVVVDDLDIDRSGVGPCEADAVLVVDPDGVLTCPVTDEFLQPVAGRDAQVVDGAGDVEHLQPPVRGTLHVRPQAGRSFQLPDLARGLVSE